MLSALSRTLQPQACIAGTENQSGKQLLRLRGFKKRQAGAPGWLSQLSSGSGHDLTVREFEPHVGLCADSSEPGPASDSVSPSLSAPPPLTLSLSFSQK